QRDDGALARVTEHPIEPGLDFHLEFAERLQSEASFEQLVIGQAILGGKSYELAGESGCGDEFNSCGFSWVPPIRDIDAGGIAHGLANVSFPEQVDSVLKYERRGQLRFRAAPIDARLAPAYL